MQRTVKLGLYLTRLYCR